MTNVGSRRDGVELHPSRRGQATADVKVHGAFVGTLTHNRIIATTPSGESELFRSNPEAIAWLREQAKA